MTRLVWLAVFVLFSGCVGAPETLYVDEDAGSSSKVIDPNADFNQDGTPDAQQDDDGDGVPDVPPYNLTVTVLDIDTGLPLVGAGVVFRLHDCEACEVPVQQVGLRTDEQGQAHLEVLASLEILAVAGAENHTTETASRVMAKSGFEESQIIQLYRTTLNATWQDAYPLTIVGWPSSAAYPTAGVHEMSRNWQFHEDAEIHAGYMDRLQSVDLSMTWKNDADSHGDLRAFIGPDDTPGLYATTAGVSSYERTGMKTHIETTTWDTAGFREQQELSDGLRLGATAGDHIITVEGLDHEAAFTAHFTGDERYQVQII